MANALDQYLDPSGDPGPSGMVPDPDGVFRVRINGAPANKLAARMEAGTSETAPTGALPGDMQSLIARIGSMIENLGTAGVEPGAASNPVVDKLFGMNGKERYQLWPEKMIRSGLALPGDVASGEQPLPRPGLRTEDVVELPPVKGWLGTSPWQQPADRVIERAQDTAGLMGGGSLPEVALNGVDRNALGIVPVAKARQLNVKTNIPNDTSFLEAVKNTPGAEVTPEGVLVNVGRAQRRGAEGSDPASGAVFYSPEGEVGYATKGNKLRGGPGGPEVVEGPTLYKNPLIVNSKPLWYQEDAFRAMGMDPEPIMKSLRKVDSSISGASDVKYQNAVNEFVQEYAPELKNEGQFRFGDHNNFGVLRDAAMNHAARQAGYDGILVHGSVGKNKPNKLVEAVDLRENKTPGPDGSYSLHPKFLSDSSLPGAPLSAIAKQQAPAFYSAVEHSVANAPQPKMGYDQWMGYLKNQPGVKPEELSWMGLGEKNPFEGKSVSKEQMQQWVDNHKVEIKEIDKSLEYDIPRAREDFEHQEGRPPHDENELRNWVNDINEYMDSNEYGVTKFGQYQLPGGENYREMLFTLPQRTAEHPANGLANKIKGLDNEWKEFMESIKFMNDGRLPNRSKWTPEQIAWENANRAERDTVFQKFKEATGGEGFNPAGEYGAAQRAPNYNSSHWDEPNVLAHTRLNDRVIDGKKSLHVEEIQSDWHQEGRKKGYKDGDTVEKLKAERDALKEESRKYSRFDEDPTEYNRLNAKFGELSGRIHELEHGVPDAPFKTTWPDLVLKRLIREASEKGYDQISWTPGEAQASRYDLSKQVDKIAVPMVNENGTRSVRIDSKQGSPFKLMVDKDGVVDGSHAGSQFSGKSLSDVVGKEMADKIMKLDKPHEFSGEGLKIGGEGMKAFYDKMLVDKANALGKKFGAKVKQDKLGDLDEAAQKEYGRDFDQLDPKRQDDLKKEHGHPVYVLPITDKMREAAMGRGFPLFATGIPFPLQPVDNNPWEKKRAK